MQHKFSRRSKRGFTLQEMLLVILLFVILAGLAVPGVIALQRSLHMKKLDEYARQIYVAAQNEMTELKSSGRLELFAKQLEVENRRLTEAQKPTDYPDRADDEEESWKDLFWISSADDTCANYLPTTMDSLTNATEKGGQFILELNPISGDVYSAFYAESGFSYEQVLALENREKATRQKAEPQLGYYGGETNEFGTVGMPTSFEPRITVVNGEELGVKISCSNLMALRRTQRYLTLTLTVEDEHEGSKAYTYKGGYDFFVNGDSITVTEILDSIEPGKNFAAQTRLHPGDNLTLTARLEYVDQNNDITIVGDETVDQVNSLFESRQTVNGKELISVNHVRHLNNLRQSIYAAAGAADVVQSGAISFLFSDWKQGTDYLSGWTESPMKQFAAVNNDTLFTNGSYNGGENPLKGFSFVAEEGDSEAALFGTLSHTQLSNIRLADCAANGANAATLAGSISDCTVENCGSYLNTQMEQNGFYSDMDVRRTTYRVNGADTAGGLIAAASNSSITASFGAVDVNGGGNVGGLLGRMTNTDVSQSYGSGNITSTGTDNGGLIGQMNGGSAADCYASGNVTSSGRSGGLIGSASAATLSNSRSYGKVADSKGNEPATGFGGFVGSYDGRTRFNQCAYLLQASYNFSYKAPSKVSGLSYTSLRDTGSDLGDIGHVENSTPYLDNLRGQGFPFRLCKNGNLDMMHYGDWPQPYQLQTSLVYYERYETPDQDGNYYGYYARTSLSGGDGSNGSWVVNSLRDEVCVEDGYALMTVYKLKSFTYTLDTGTGTTSKATVAVNDSDNALESATEYQSALMLSNASLVFENENSESHQETTITGAWVYRLPFALQVNERKSATTFWETLTVTGNSVLDNTAVFENQVFYYCPDFAKNAVNPVDGSTQKPEEPGGAGSPVYVRSARQLNALSRSIYYWNTTTGGQRIEFVQETDIDFGKYIPKNTSNQKIYCGKVFDLMDTSTSNVYANKPIGYSNEVKIWANGKLLESNFQNTYDGRSHKIIDYCQDDPTYRFSGLFGEVSQCIIKNVVMVASDPEHESAYVKGGFYSSQDQPGSVATLVGLVYMEKNTGNENGIGKPKAVIENCSATGYVVEYYKVKDYGKNYALGGLIGFNFGVVRNCSAVCTVRANSAGGSTTGFIGGLVGSLNGVGTIENSYAGSTFTGTSAWMSIGGICGGFCDIYGHGQGNYGLRSMAVTNCYSYCTIDRANLTAGGYGHIFGTVVTLAPDGNNGNGIQVSNCYYLTDTIADITINSKENTAQSIPCSRAELRTLTFAASDIGSDGKHGIYDGVAFASGAVPDADHSFHYNTVLDGKTYPFPGLVRRVNADGSYEDYAHYGDWPDGDDQSGTLGDLELTQPIYMVYYEQYADGSIGLYTMDVSGKTGSTIRDDLEIQKAGYAFLTNTRNVSVCIPSWDSGVSGDAAFGAVIQANYSGSYDLVEMAQSFTERITGFGYDHSSGMFAFKQDGVQIQSGYVNGSFAMAMASSQMTTYQIRTAQQLQATSGLAYTFNFTHDITIPADFSFTSLVGTSGEVYNGNGFAIRGLKTPLFANSSGCALNKLALRDVNITSSGDTAALIAGTNNGSVNGCSVTGSVTSTGGNAAGLVLTHNGGTISNSYFSGTIHAAGQAAGCYLDGWGIADQSYAQVEFNGTASECYGFSPSMFASKVTACYYVGGTVESSGTRCSEIDWSAAVDANGVPNDNWPNGIRTTSAQDNSGADATPAA